MCRQRAGYITPSSPLRAYFRSANAFAACQTVPPMAGAFADLISTLWDGKECVPE